MSKTKTQLGLCSGELTGTRGAGSEGLPWGTALPACWHVLALVRDARQPLVFRLQELLIGPESASTASTYTNLGLQQAYSTTLNPKIYHVSELHVAGMVDRHV